MYVIPCHTYVIAASFSHTEKFDVLKLSLNTVGLQGDLFTQINWDDLSVAGNPGEPAMPRKYVSFALPATAQNVRVTNVSKNVASEVQLSHPFFPAQEYGPMNNVVPNVTMPDSIAYNGMDELPSNQVEIVGVEEFPSVNVVVTVAIYPISYIPGHKRITVANSVSFNIGYDIASKKGVAKNFGNEDEYINSSNRNSDIAFLKSLVVNPNDVSSGMEFVPSAMPQFMFRDNFGSNGENELNAFQYTIVTSNELAPAFERLVALKRLKGIDAGIVCMEDILNHPVYGQGDKISNIRDDAGCLREYLREARKQAEYILLGGKPPIVPTRYATAQNYANRQALEKMDSWEYYNIPTDFYFSEFYNNWNYDGDDLYGEPIGDFQYNRSVLKVGRLLCTTQVDVDNYIDKLEFYEMNPGNGDLDYLSNSYLYFSKDAAYDGWGRQKPFLHEPTLVADPIAFNHPNQDVRYEGDVKTKGADVVNDLNAKHYVFWGIHGHGTPEGHNLGEDKWPRYGLTALDNERRYIYEESKNGLDNIESFGYPGYMYSMSCATMPFDSPSYNGFGEFDTGAGNPLTMNFGESYTMGKNYGGVAYLGYTRYGYFGYSAYMESRFFAGLNIAGLTKREIGQVENYSKTTVASPRLSEHYHAHSIRLGHNILGDPQLRVWRGGRTAKSDDFKISRIGNDGGISVFFHGSDCYFLSTYGCRAVAVEPNGDIHVLPFTSNKVTFENISQNSNLSVLGDDMVVVPLDLWLQNIIISKSDYVYVRTAKLGSQISKYCDYGDVVIDSGTCYTIDASDDVSLNVGTIIKPGATLKVITPKNCHLAGVTVEAGGNLEIYAGSATVDWDVQNRIEHQSISCMKYNKYGMLEDGPLPLVSRSSIMRRVQESDGYRPMFEVGKTWVYRLVDKSWGKPDTREDMWRVLKVDGVTEIDGKEYFVVNAYTDGAATPDCDAPYGYFREDVDSREVFYVRDERYIPDPIGIHEIPGIMAGEERLLYRFCKPVVLGCVTYDSEPDDYINVNDGKHRGVGADGPCGVFEGVGAIMMNNGEFSVGRGCDIFGPTMMVSGDGQGYVPLLYSVNSPDGSEILRIDGNGMGRIDTLEQYRCDIVVAKEGGVVRIKGGKTLGHISVIDLQGVEIYSCFVGEAECTIPLQYLSKGVNIVKIEQSVYKVVI